MTATPRHACERTTAARHDLRSLAATVNAKWAEAEAHAVAATAAARCAGDALIAAKALLAHGEFGPWLRENCTLSVRHAQSCMALARGWGANASRVAHLPLREALSLLREPRQPGAPGVPQQADEDDVPIGDISPLPLTEWTYGDDDEVAARFDASLRKFGQLQPLLTRMSDDGRHEAITGGRHLAAMRRLGFATVRVRCLGVLTDAEAVELCLTSVLSAETRYAAIAQAVRAALDAGATIEGLSAIGPFGAERIGYFRTLTGDFFAQLQADLARERGIAAEIAAERPGYDHQCPSCGFGWNQFAAGGRAMHEARVRRERMAEEGR